MLFDRFNIPFFRHRRRQNDLGNASCATTSNTTNGVVAMPSTSTPASTAPPVLHLSPPPYTELPPRAIADPALPPGRPPQTTRTMLKTIPAPHTQPQDSQSNRGLPSHIKMDPLIAASWHNSQLSLLHRLPDAVLTRIIHMLDSDADIECFRRAARRFPALCAPVILTRHRTYSSRFCQGPLTWPRLQSIYHLGHKREIRLQSKGDKDAYCAGCFAAADDEECWGRRVARLRRYLHCSECEADHPACLFEPAERDGSRPENRVCIARRVFVRICAHNGGIVYLSDLEGLRCKIKDMPGDWKGNWIKVKLKCEDSSHIVACQDLRRRPEGDPHASNPYSNQDCPCVDYPHPIVRLIHPFQTQHALDRTPACRPQMTGPSAPIP
ncbi:hypothetical protein OPQ81_010407 [Rhizoctonia solani]|nr:hypothetical protein OPQ81_010407 [Rhizoctonia solani]